MNWINYEVRKYKGEETRFFSVEFSRSLTEAFELFGLYIDDDSRFPILHSGLNINILSVTKNKTRPGVSAHEARKGN